MMPPFVVFPTNRIAHFVEVSLYFILSSTTSEFNALIQVCDTNTFIGARDKLMLLLMYNTGVRVSELLEIKISDIHGADSINHASVIIHGKGRKQREVPLWKTTVKYINKYLKTYPAECTDYLFINKNGDELTRSGVVYEHSLINLYLK